MTVAGVGGRPLKFQSVEELKIKIDDYFKSCWRKKLDMFGTPIKDKETGEHVLEQFKPFTISGLAVGLNTSRETLMNYEDKGEYFDTIKAAKEKCYAYTEESLFVGKNPSGAIFSLKNNYGWVDKQEIAATNLNTNLNINEEDSTALLEKSTQEEKELLAEGKLSWAERQEIINRG